MLTLLHHLRFGEQKSCTEQGLCVTGFPDEAVAGLNASFKFCLGCLMVRNAG